MVVEDFYVVALFNAQHAKFRNDIKDGRCTADSIRQSLLARPPPGHLVEKATHASNSCARLASKMTKLKNGVSKENYAELWAVALVHAASVWTMETGEVVSVDVHIDDTWMVFTTVDLDDFTRTVRVKWRDWMRMSSEKTMSAFVAVLRQILSQDKPQAIH